MEILVVEDDFVSRCFLQKMLEGLGHACLTAENGKKGWELFQVKKPTVVISDWMMPEMDGLTLCKNIREASLTSYVYFIMLSSNDHKEDCVKGLAAGADDYLVKPVNPDELHTRIRTGQRILDLEARYKTAHHQLLQSEKMASIGQLAAGVAHEINNPTGFISSNLKTLADYEKDIRTLLEGYHQIVELLQKASQKNGLPPRFKAQLDGVTALEKKLDMEYLMDDLRALTKECREGTERIKKIILDLKDFAHPGNDKLQEADINKGIESTLNVVWNEIKYKATVTKNLGDLPRVKCLPHQLNQVFMNLLINAAQAIEEKGEITIATRAVNGSVEIQVSDTGYGIAPENLSKVFDPFFTTKEVGTGTGLGLNVAYNIVEKHKGTIQVESTVGKGTTFTINIPVA